MKIRTSLQLLVAGALLAPAAADAHHSFAMFEPEKTLEKNGVVKEVNWANPHVWIYFVVTNDQGQPEEWGLEAGATNTLLRQGWKRDSVKPGDKIAAVFRPMKDGTRAGSMQSIRAADGTVLTIGVQGARPEEEASAAKRVPADALAPSADPRDISGVWYKPATAPKSAGQPTGVNSGRGAGQVRPVEGGEPPYTKAGKIIVDRRSSAEELAKPHRQPSDSCMPPGVTALAVRATPYQIVQTPGQVTLINEFNHNVRIVYLDEKQPSNPAPTFMGHSVGHWEGDTLVIDTVGQRENWLDVVGSPISANAHIVERFKKIDGGKNLEMMMTVDDPINYTKPWNIRFVYLWSPRERIQEYSCEEDNDRAEGPRAVASDKRR